MKPKVAFFDLTGCEGCQLQVINLGDGLLELLRHVDLVNFREAISEKGGDYEVAIIDGAVSQPGDVKKVRAIRRQAKVIVTIGACSSLGGVNCIKNFHSLKEVGRYVYGMYGDKFPTIPARPVWAEVPVDYQVRGCPINPDEFVLVMSAILRGQEPVIPNYPVCVECRSRENVCLYDLGQTCLGPVTRAGCGAACPTGGNYCWGCRGLVDNPSTESTKNLLKEHGLDNEHVLKFFRFADGWLEVARDA